MWMQFSRYLFSARSYLVNYVYYLVCLCFGIFGVKNFAYSYISVLFIRIRPSGLWTPNNPQSDFVDRLMSKKQGSSVPSVNVSDATVVAFH